MSWGTVATVAVSAAGSYLSSKNKKKSGGSTQFQDLRSPQLQQLGDQYVSTLKSATQQYKPGADFGDVSVGLTDPEQQSLTYLDQYLQGDIRESDLYQLGRGEITDTLAGKYDPSTGQYYKATTAAMDLETQRAIDTARRGQAARGSFRSSGGLRQEGDILEGATASKQQLLAELGERERTRRSQAGSQALGLSQFEANIPLTKTQYAQQYGMLERKNEVLNLEREYNKWRNQRAELMNAFTAAGQASNQGQPLYGTLGYQQSSSSSGNQQLMSSLGGLVGNYFGGSGGASGGGAGGSGGGINPAWGAAGSAIGSYFGSR